MKKNKFIKQDNRPFFCYDKTAKVLYSTFSKDTFKRGFSFFCYGKLKNLHIFKEKEAIHKNDICHCYYTPLKGAVRYFVCAGDLWGELNAKIYLLNKVDPVGECIKCQKKIRRHIRICLVTKKGKICYECLDKGKG